MVQTWTVADSDSCQSGDQDDWGSPPPASPLKRARVDDAPCQAAGADAAVETGATVPGEWDMDKWMLEFAGEFSD